MSEEKKVYVKLVSAEGHEFFLDKEIAMVRKDLTFLRVLFLSVCPSFVVVV